MKPAKLTEEAITELLRRTEHMLREGRIVVVVSSPAEELEVAVLTYSSDKATGILLSQAALTSMTGEFNDEIVMTASDAHADYEADKED